MIDIPAHISADKKHRYKDAAAQLRTIGEGKAIEFTSKQSGVHGGFASYGLKVSTRKISDGLYAVWMVRRPMGSKRTVIT